MIRRRELNDTSEQFQAGSSPEEVMKAMGFSPTFTYEWLARYRAGRWHALGSYLSWITLARLRDAR